MSIVFRDRISGAKRNHPGVNPVLGIWQIVRTTDEVALLNSVTLGDATFLVPDRTNHWDILSESSGEHLQGTFPPFQILDDLDVEGILALGGHLDSMINASASYFEWANESPLIPRISERMGLQPLDKFVEEHLEDLEHVCRKPRGHLHREVERLPVGRARRIPAHATAYLAAHTEDWARPTLNSVQPKRVLALVQDDQWDIYENRVAARLVDHLRLYLERRLAELQRLADILERVGDHSDVVSKAQYWRRRERIARLWGSALQANEGYRLVKATLKRVGNLRRRVAVLMDSVLYKEVPRNATVPNTLRQTNIFSGDLRYRGVALLWDEWAKQKQSRNESPAEVQDKQQRLCYGFDDYCFLLVIRALDVLGYEPPDIEVALARNVRYKLDGLHGAIELEWVEDGTIHVHALRTLHIVPVAASLSTSVDEDALRSQIGEIQRMAAEDTALTLILHPSPSQSNSSRMSVQSRRRLWGLGHEHRHSSTSNLGLLPVSPWDIGSVERVARALRWVMMGLRMLEYPPRAPRAPKDIDMRLLAEWTEMSRHDVCHVLRRPSEHQWQQIEMARRARHDELGEIQKRLDDLPSYPLDDRRARSDANQQRTRLNHDLSRVKQQCEEMDAFCRSTESAFNVLDALACCPVCLAKTSSHLLEARQQGTFRVTCDCGSSWGTQTCGKCPEKYPFLRVKAPEPSVNETSVGMVDEWLGSDVLAAPCVHYAFMCPECGNRSCTQCAA